MPTFYQNVFTSDKNIRKLQTRYNSDWLEKSYDRLVMIIFLGTPYCMISSTSCVSEKVTFGDFSDKVTLGDFSDKVTHRSQTHFKNI